MAEKYVACDKLSLVGFFHKNLLGKVGRVKLVVELQAGAM
jgi:hypothetical protein